MKRLLFKVRIAENKEYQLSFVRECSDGNRENDSNIQVESDDLADPYVFCKQGRIWGR